jgi:hypothetical protein
MYTRAQVDKFRSVWSALDEDGSGQVDIEELLYAKVFSTSTLKVTKALFATIDEDKSGTVSLKEMLRVAFPLSDGDGRNAIAKYLHFLDAREKARLARSTAVDAGSEEAVMSLRAKIAATSTASEAPPSGLGLEVTDARGRPKVPPKGTTGAALQVLARSRDSRQTVKDFRQAAASGDGEPNIYG